MGSATQSSGQLDLPEAYRLAVDQGGMAERHRRAWRQAGEWAAWLVQDTLKSLSWEQALVLYRASGGTRVAQFRTNALDEVRDSLDFLLYDNITLEGRFAECAAEDGSYKLAGAGKELASHLLCLREPGLFAPWRGYTERALRMLGSYPRTLRRGHLGLRYLDLLDALQSVRQRLALPDFQTVDSFCFALAKAGGPSQTGVARGKLPEPIHPSGPLKR